MKHKLPALAIAVIVLLGGCGSDGGGYSGKVPEDQVIKPADGKPGWETTDVMGVEISVRPDWEKIGPLSPGRDAVQYQFAADESSSGTRSLVQVTTFPVRGKSAKKMMLTIEAQSRGKAGATDFTKEQIVWPGAKDAWYVTFLSHIPINGKIVEGPAEELVLDLPGGGQVQVRVTARTQDFDKEHLHEMLQTVTITDDAGEN